MNQYNLNFKYQDSFNEENFFVSDSNNNSYNILIKEKDFSNFIFLSGPEKSGKSHIATMWAKKNNSIVIKLNSFSNDQIVKLDNNVLIDDVFENLSEEKLFHIINHCKICNLKILLTSNLLPKNYKFNLLDLSSRMNVFYLIKIFQPDDQLIFNLIIKLFSDRQIKLKNQEVINYLIKRIDRSFDNVYSIVNKIDEYSLSSKREITIPLIREII
tara:strand:- start:2192 stop:2833 length:642 start_codon:yes stop_codon:yes gene_type:complete